MALQDQLYQLSARDLQGPLLVPFAYGVNVSLGAGAYTVQCAFPSTLHPIDKIVHLQSWGIVATPGIAAQVYNTRLMWLPTPAISIVLDGKKLPAGGAGLTNSFGEVVDRLLPTRPDLLIITDFNDTLLHSVYATISGWYLPRGNVTGV